MPTNIVNNRYYVPMKRFEADIKVEGLDFVTKAMLLLYEMNEDGVILFSENNLPIGAQASLVVHAPNTIYLKGKIAMCRPILTGMRVIRKMQLDFRVGMNFEFDKIELRREFEDHYRRYMEPLTERSA